MFNYRIDSIYMTTYVYQIIKNYRGETDSEKLDNYVRDMELMKKISIIKLKESKKE